MIRKKLFLNVSQIHENFYFYKNRNGHWKKIEISEDYRKGSSFVHRMFGHIQSVLVQTYRSFGP